MLADFSTQLTGLRLGLNAQDGDVPLECDLPATALAWVLSNPCGVTAPTLALPPEANLREWSDPAVGWGIVVNARMTRLPKALVTLVAERKAPVFRYIPNWTHSFRCLRNVEVGCDVDMTAAPRGIASGCLPYYLLIVGSPLDVPWEIQYMLSANRCAGRLDLDEDGLTNYVGALTSGFGGKGGADPTATVVWSVDLGTSDSGDVTTLMRQAIAEPLKARIDVDGDRTVSSIPDVVDGVPTRPTCQALLSALAADRPGLVVTTSHGRTGPHNDVERLRAQVGLPVDADGQQLSPADLTRAWEPAGAIWYAHACCSAGTQGSSLFSGLLKGTSLEADLAALEQAGPGVAPLPKHLLGCRKPLRAFIGHVEPTFDWTLRDPVTGAAMTWPLVDALYPNIFRDPVGYAFRDWYPKIGSLQTAYMIARRRLAHLKAQPLELLSLQLQMADVLSTVILGDPAALLGAA